MQKPDHISLNGLRVKVQNWDQRGERIAFTTVVHGEYLAERIISAVSADELKISLQEGRILQGTGSILQKRSTGSGPTAVVRMEIELALESAKNNSAQISQDDKLDLILEEIRALRREIHALQRTPFTPTSGITPPTAGKTLLDFDLGDTSE